MQNEHTSSDPNVIQLPRPTAWPLVLALGISLIMAGMVTNIAVAILGLLLSIAGAVGWALQVLPHEAHEAVPVSSEEITVTTTRTVMERPARRPASHAPRTILPIETFRITTGNQACSTDRPE